MKQYCRYCAEAFGTDNDDFVWCDAKDYMKSKSSCLAQNKCDKFKLNEIDLFNARREYKPMDATKRQARIDDYKNQTRLF